MPPPPNNRKAVWHHPRDSKEDRLLSYVVESRQVSKNRQSPGEPHPLADSDPNYEGLIFLYREPASENGSHSRDWYGPSRLTDDLLSSSTSGAGYQSSILYARGTPPPEGDPRVEAKGQERGHNSVSWSWSIDPDTNLPGPNLIDLAILSGPSFTGDEVYLDIDDTSSIPGLDPGTFEIVRHLPDGRIQIKLDYDSSVIPSGSVDTSAFEACYVLDGYTDSESAPGVMSGKYHVRNFNYRLSVPTSTSRWDESLGLELCQESRLVPASWARLWEEGKPLAGNSSDESSVNYQPASKNIQTRTTTSIKGSPDEDGLTWSEPVKIQVPTICTKITIPWAWAYAESTDGDTVSFDEDFGLAQETCGPFQHSATATTYRRIVKEADIDATISAFPAEISSSQTLVGGGALFTFQPKTYPIRLSSYQAHGGDNIWTRAKVQVINFGPFLLKDGAITVEIPPTGWGGAAPGSNSGLNVDEGTITLTDPNPPPWGGNVLWSVNTTKARWGYWIIDFIVMTLPNDPAQ